MMKSSGSRCVFKSVLIAAGLLYLVEAAGGVNEFRRCYNTSVETHCFTVQYDASNRTLVTDNDNARKRCKSLNSTLIVIKDEETNNFVQNYMTDPDNPIKNQYVWTDAYRINDFNNSYTWHWLNSRLPNLAASYVLNTHDSKWYVASLASNGERFYLDAQQPHLKNSYVCEYEMSSCSSINSSNAHYFDARCYDAINDQITWYDARNRCLKRGGDLASFDNVTSINFTSWLSAESDIRYWIGLRFGGYIWKDSGDDAKFVKWVLNDDWTSTCLIVRNSGPNFSWFPQACNITNSVVCHSATTLHTTVIPTTFTTITPSAITTSRSEVPQSIKSTTPYGSSDSASSKRFAIGVGVGVGLGVAVLIAVIVIVICVVIRKRRRESSTDQPVESATVNERGDTTYGIVVPSKSSGQAVDAGGANSTAEQTVYAPLQIL